MRISVNKRWKLKTAAVCLAVVCVVAVRVAMPGQSPLKQPPDPALATLGGGFISSTAQVNGTTLHYVRGGLGPAVFLLHGFPEDWYEFHQVMPRLAKQFTVIAVDLRGLGGSAPSAGGYDAANMAEDIHQLAEQLHLEHVYVVGHDVGVEIGQSPSTGLTSFISHLGAYRRLGFYRRKWFRGEIMKGSRVQDAPGFYRA